MHRSNRETTKMNLHKTAKTVCLLKSLLNGQMFPDKRSKLANPMRLFFYWFDYETTQMDISEIANTVCLLKSLINDQMYHK